MKTPPSTVSAGPAVCLGRSAGGVLNAEVELHSQLDGTRRPLIISSLSLAAVTVVGTNEHGLVDLEIEATEADPVHIRCNWPIRSAVTLWRADSTARRDLPGDRGTRHTARSVRSAPVAALVGVDDRNILTAALSVEVRFCDFNLAINEESAEAVLQVVVQDVAPTGDALRFRCRIDMRPQHFAIALGGVTDTWRDNLADRSAPVPELVHQPMYSTWYSDHQQISAALVEQHARASAAYGCRAIIVDDGWQTDNAERGYAYCGDWEPTDSSFPDMVAHVERVHGAGLRYVLWIAPALIGPQSRAWRRLQHLTLGRIDGLGASVLDPRFPDVREHIVECCLRPLRDWGVDGLKIDFVDAWAMLDRPWREGMDCRTVDEGVERVLEAVAAGCRKYRGQVLVEFRQDYVGPRLWPFGTFVRAADCPMDTVENRVRTIDARLLAGDRAVHSDMLMWHPQASADDVASQFIAVLFATPQISVAPERLSPEHQRVMRYWLDFMKTHANTLLHGELLPSRPDARYAQVVARSAQQTIVVAYTDPVIRLDERPAGRLVLVNGTGRTGLVLDTPVGGHVELVVGNCVGTELARTTISPAAGPWTVPVPVSGVATVAPGPARAPSVLRDKLAR